jgi:hypothetical protein
MRVDLPFDSKRDIINSTHLALRAVLFTLTRTVQPGARLLKDFGNAINDDSIFIGIDSNVFWKLCTDDKIMGRQFCSPSFKRPEVKRSCQSG